MIRCYVLRSLFNYCCNNSQEFILFRLSFFICKYSDWLKISNVNTKNPASDGNKNKRKWFSFQKIHFHGNNFRWSFHVAIKSREREETKKFLFCSVSFHQFFMKANWAETSLRISFIVILWEEVAQPASIAWSVNQSIQKFKTLGQLMIGESMESRFKISRSDLTLSIHS